MLFGELSHVIISTTSDTTEVLSRSFIKSYVLIWSCGELSISSILYCIRIFDKTLLWLVRGAPYLTDAVLNVFLVFLNFDPYGEVNVWDMELYFVLCLVDYIYIFYILNLVSIWLGSYWISLKRITLAGYSSSDRVKVIWGWMGLTLPIFVLFIPNTDTELGYLLNLFFLCFGDSTILSTNSLNLLKP